MSLQPHICCYVSEAQVSLNTLYNDALQDANYGWNAALTNKNVQKLNSVQLLNLYNSSTSATRVYNRSQPDTLWNFLQNFLSESEQNMF